MPRVTLIVFECLEGSCGWRAYKEVSEAPTVPEMERLIEKARCSQCGSTGDVKPFWDNGWIGDMTATFKAHIDREQQARTGGLGGKS
jgi:hypothetical protein